MAFSVVFHLPSKLIGIGSTSVVYWVAKFHITIAVELQVQFCNIALFIRHGDSCSVLCNICLCSSGKVLKDGFIPILSCNVRHQPFFIVRNRHARNRLRKPSRKHLRRIDHSGGVFATLTILIFVIVTASSESQAQRHTQHGGSHHFKHFHKLQILFYPHPSKENP